MTIDRWIAIIALIATIPIFKGWALSVLQWNRKRKIKSLELQLKLFNTLKNDHIHLTIWIGQSILLVTAFIAASLMFNGVAIDPEGQRMSSGFMAAMATIAYIISAYKLGQLKRLRNYEDTVESIQKDIDKFNA